MKYAHSLFLALLAGASLTLGYAPFGLWPIVPVALAFALVLLHRSQPSRSFATAYSFSFGWFAVGISWVHVSIADFGGLPLIASVALMALLCGYLALFPALALWLCKRYFSLPQWPLALGFLWVSVEWLRSWMLTGFPWLSLGYSQIDSPLSGWMPVIGETGTTALLVIWCASLAVAWQSKRWQPAISLSLVLFAAGWFLQQWNWVTPNGDNTSVAMVQGNIQQELRWTPEQDQPTMDKYRALSEPLWQSAVVIWPEAAVPRLEVMATDFLLEMDTLAAQRDSALVTGIVNYNFESRQAYNNVIVLGKRIPQDSDGHYRYNHQNRYAKHHLLPIGEFIPFEDWLRGIAPLFDLPMSSFSRGDYEQANLQANGLNMATALCFEIAFPRQVRANLREHTHGILTLSNDAWFGDSHGPAQHLEIARVRAKEFGLPVMRATNNGITAFIDHKGTIKGRLPQFEAATLASEVQHVKGVTPYRYLADVPVWLLTASLFVLAWLRRQQPQVAQQPSSS